MEHVKRSVANSYELDRLDFFKGQKRDRHPGSQAFLMVMDLISTRYVPE